MEYAVLSDKDKKFVYDIVKQIIYKKPKNQGGIIDTIEYLKNSKS